LLFLGLQRFLLPYGKQNVLFFFEKTNFVHYEPTENHYKEGVISIFANLGMFGIKLWAGIVSGSVALTADAWHTLSDSISSLVVIVGARLSAKKPDKDHPFGHGHWEHISAIFIGFFLGIIAYGFFVDAIESYLNQETANFGTLAIVATVISILGKEGLAQYAFYLGRKSDSSAIKADGWHHRSDALSSVVILAGIFLSKYAWWIDSLLGLIVALFILYAAFDVIKRSVNKLLGEKPSPELLKSINHVIKKVHHEDVELHHFHLHNYITQKEITFHIKLDGDKTIKEAHKLTTKIEETLYRDLSIRATIHIEPEDCEHKFD